MSQRAYSDKSEIDLLQQLHDFVESEADIRQHLHDLHEQCIAQMMADPDLTEEQKQELLRQLELPDEEWEPIELPEGAEPISETIIKMRRGE